MALGCEEPWRGSTRRPQGRLNGREDGRLGRLAQAC
jgi:hypothetical protein